MMKKQSMETCIKICFILITVIIFTGCFGRTKSPYVVDQFTLDYPSPVLPGLTSTHELIRIERFSVAQSFNSTAMVYKPQMYRLDTYPYSRWRVNPGDMMSDFLIRDIGKSLLFKGVFSYYSDEPVRFVLEGALEEFFESDEGPEGRAILTVNITFLDRTEREVSKKILFQKAYQFASPVKEKSPDGFTGGMSANMSHLSEALIKDLDNTLKARGKK
ncbi:MAG: hypothetical protein C0399_05970 [Syntrophus sp. (in: bacteria)]|nr:hypothetical protein [Syntrophus sp. (in: bacteria)]